MDITEIARAYLAHNAAESGADEVIRDLLAEIERISALWIAETRENERLRALLTDAPVLVINERYAAVIGEDVCLAYMQAIREWHPKVQAALTGDSVGEK